MTGCNSGTRASVLTEEQVEKGPVFQNLWTRIRIIKYNVNNRAKRLRHSKGHVTWTRFIRFCIFFLCVLYFVFLSSSSFFLLTGMEDIYE